MNRWEYLTLDSSKNYGTTKYYINGEMQPAIKNQPLHMIINQIGGQGWEMVGISAVDDTQTFIFKRAAGVSTGNLKRPTGQLKQVKSDVGK